MTPGGAVVTQMHQPWRRGEYAPVIRFYQEHGIPIAKMITAGSLEGGDVCIVEPGVMLIGNGEERTEVDAARQLAGWMEAEGWEVRIEPIPSQFVHIDVLVSILAPEARRGLRRVGLGRAGRLAARQGLRDPRGLHRRRVQARRQRDLARRRAGALDGAARRSLNEQLRALGLEVFDPDLSMFTMGGGGAHCLAQALDRDPG